MTVRFRKGWNKRESMIFNLPESSHQQVNVLERKTERIAEEFICRNAVVQVNTLADAVIGM